MLSASLLTQLDVEQIGPDHYVTKCLPVRMGNTAPIAYGGVTAGSTVLAACKSVKDGYYLFSVLGSFHGPTRVDRKLYCRVFQTRNTKTFSTRRVIAYQIQDDKSERVCAELMVDFHVSEQGLFQYTATPDPQYSDQPEDPSKTASSNKIAERLVREGLVSQAAEDARRKTFGMADAFFEQRLCLDGVSAQNLNGLAKNVVTTQDHLSIHEKSSAEWVRALQPLHSHAEQMTALAFYLDGALSFLPLNLDHKDLYDAGPCSTLEFSLRILRPEVLMNNWHLRERRTIAAHGGRTYSESRLWNEAKQLVAIESQTSICRPPAKSTKAAGKL